MKKKTTVKTKKAVTRFPPGWDEARVQKLIAYYENQTDEAAVVEAEAALARQRKTVMEIPVALVPVVRGLIAEHQRARDARK